MIKVGGLVIIAMITWQCSNSQNNSKVNLPVDDKMETSDMNNLDTAVFGAGCFWCTEAVFAEVKGVIKVESGYSGGHVRNPGYREVSNGSTGHAEVTLIQYDSSVVSYKELLEIFWKTHDPTTLNRQGADRGTQYRSAIFYTSEEQKEIAEYYKMELDAAGIWVDPIVTEITAFTEFFKAEDYHQDYYATNPNAGYCNVVITPKLEKFRKVFADKLK